MGETFHIMKKVAIIVGHRSKRKGAFSEHLQTTEYDYFKCVASFLGDIADIYYRPNTPFVSEAYRIKQLANEVNRNQYEIVLSLHFNAFSDQKANGVTALHYITNRETKEFCKQFVNSVTANFGIKKRPLIAIQSKSQRGGTLILSINSPTIILEPFFGTNFSDSMAFYCAHKRFADLLRKLINSNFKE